MSNAEQTKIKFVEFLASKKIDARRVGYASEAIEKLRPEDRVIRHTRKHKKAEASKAEGGEKKKPRSGRPVTDRAMSAALSGKAISGPQKTRILRAVNRILEQKKQEPVSLDALFLSKLSRQRFLGAPEFGPIAANPAASGHVVLRRPRPRRPRSR